MVTIMERPARSAAEEQSGKNDHSLDDFLAELGELSRRYGLAVGDGALLYVMEPEDHTRAYTANDESALSFA